MNSIERHQQRLPREGVQRCTYAVRPGIAFQDPPAGDVERPG